MNNIWRKMSLVLFFLLPGLLTLSCVAIGDNIPSASMVSEENSSSALADEGLSSAAGKKLKPSIEPLYTVTTTNNISFGTGSIIKVIEGITPTTKTVDMPLYLDIYEPVDAPEGLRPVVMWMYGNGFVSQLSSRKGNFVPIAHQLASRGYVVIAIDYRTAYSNPAVSEQAQPYLTMVNNTNQYWVPKYFKPPHWPLLTEEQYKRGIAAAYDDGLTALHWIESESERRSLDMSRLVFMGSSSGSTTGNSLAYLSDELGIKTPEISIMIDLWGSMDYSRFDGLSEIEESEADLFIIHSIYDEAIQIANASEMAARAKAIGLSHKFIELEPNPDGITEALKNGTGHGLALVPILKAKAAGDDQTLFEHIIAFLNANLP
ncbi:MAG: alpha/beta hydrolase [Chloroflexota bacterium]